MGRWTGIGILLVTGGVLALGLALRQPTQDLAAPAPKTTQTVARIPPARAFDSRPLSINAAPSSPSPAPRSAASATPTAKPSPAPELKAVASNTPATAQATPIETPQPSTVPSPSSIPAQPVAEPTPAVAPPAAVTQTAAQKTGPTNVTMKKDTVIGIRLDEAVSTASAHAEDKISAKVSRNVIVDGVTAIPAGTRLEGTVVQVERPSAASPRGKLGIRFTSIVRPDNSRVAITTATIFREASDPSASTSSSLNVNAFSAVLTGTARSAPLRSNATGSSGGSASPVPPAPQLREAQLPAGSLLTVQLTVALTITVDRDPQ